MLKINNLKKYFNRGRPNEIHAVDDISLTLEGTGLVVLLGESGCGKTTLLNAIGGLDRTDSGAISLDNEKIEHYNAKRWDVIRNRRIGYIFQNYNLISDITVYKNLEAVLKLAGLTEKADFNKRIEYALSLVGMEKYKNRRPDTLSGGQQQRVGIARALVKGADIIIADEPTGNLDDKNTMAVMEILKGISKHCLVVLVTHEEKLADFYGDRIIKLVDGKVVSDVINENTESLEHRHADIIYLGDLEKNEYKVGDININYFFDKNETPIALDILNIEGKILLRPRIGEGKVTFVTDSSTIKLIDGKYQRKEKQDINIKVDNTILSKINNTSQSIFNTNKVALNSVNNYLSINSAKKKNPFRTMYISAILLVILIALIAPSFVFNVKSDLQNDSNMLKVFAEYNSVLPFEDNAAISKVMNREIYNSPLYISLPNSPFNNTVAIYSLRGSIFSFAGSNTSVIPYSAISSASLAAGKVYLDILLFERLAITDEYKALGLTSKEKLIGQTITNFSYGYGGYGYEPYPIDDYGGYDPSDYEGYFSYTIEGFVDRGEPLLYVSDVDFAKLTRTDVGLTPYVYVLAKDLKAAQKLLVGTGFSVKNCKEEQIKDFYLAAFSVSITKLIIVLVILIVQIIAISKMSKASFIGKIKQLTILRAVGTPRSDIVKGIAVENTVTISLSTLRGWIISSVVLFALYSLSIVRKINLIYYSWWLCLAIGALLFSISMFIALWSPLMLLRKTPAELMAKYDI
ncbi:MAG: ABC transporter ATP-binding protein/permease [Clostridia bacterium]|nr:ABC transporter ATP-binding protein/permease [Clostridia bacterium]